MELSEITDDSKVETEASWDVATLPGDVLSPGEERAPAILLSPKPVAPGARMQS